MGSEEESRNSASPQLFAYHRAIAPMLWAFVGLATIELLVVHLLLSFWSPLVALILSVVTAASILWLVHAIRSLRRLPVEVRQDGVLMRVGVLRSVFVPRDRISGLRGRFTGEDVKNSNVLNLALIAWPNVLLVTDGPLPVGRRSVIGIAHRLDDPTGFTEAVESLLSSRPSS